MGFARSKVHLALAKVTVLAYLAKRSTFFEDRLALGYHTIFPADGVNL